MFSFKVITIFKLNSIYITQEKQPLIPSKLKDKRTHSKRSQERKLNKRVIQFLFPLFRFLSKAYLSLQN